MFTLGALKRRGTRVLMSFMAHSVYEAIAGIVSGSVIDTLGANGSLCRRLCVFALLARTIRLYDTFHRVEHLRSHLTLIEPPILPVRGVRQQK